jgi:oligopeptide transport system substrate-binding protein
MLLPRGREPVARYLQVEWRTNLGVEITWETMESRAFTDKLDRDPPHMVYWGWRADYPDPDGFLRSFYARRYTHWRDETYERLVEEARRVLDQGERMKLYGQADKILVEAAVIVPIIYSRLHQLVKPWVKRFPISAFRHWHWKDVIIEPH